MEYRGVWLQMHACVVKDWWAGSQLCPIPLVPTGFNTAIFCLSKWPRGGSAGIAGAPRAGHQRGQQRCEWGRAEGQFMHAHSMKQSVFPSHSHVAWVPITTWSYVESRVFCSYIVSQHLVYHPTPQIDARWVSLINRASTCILQAFTFSTFWWIRFGEYMSLCFIHHPIPMICWSNDDLGFIWRV